LETLRQEKEAAEETTRRLRLEKEAVEELAKRESSERQGLEEQICSMQQKWENERTMEQERTEELQTAREILITQVVQLKESLRSDTASFGVKLQNLRDEMTEKSKQFSAAESRLAETQTQLESHKADSSRDKSKLEATIGQQLDLLSQQKTELSDIKRQLELQQRLNDTAFVERDAAASKLLELEAAVSAISEERRGLLERCLAAEGETERSRNLTIELRRKMDDSQAALHELGRENQSLQVDLARQSGRKWKDDTDVNECTGCSSGFSLTNRKHHCRNCGSIFCKDCSSKQALMDGYKKPQRVCEACFGELGKN